jgi:predicted nucleic acid-binding protein
VICFVLDASVALKWFLPATDESLVEESRELLTGYLRGDHSLIVPDLFWPEVASGLWKAARHARSSKSTAVRAIADMKERGLPTVPSANLVEEALSLAAGYGCTVYDGFYLALAKLIGGQMVTADERLVRGVGSRLPVRWLGAL